MDLKYKLYTKGRQEVCSQIRKIITDDVPSTTEIRIKYHKSSYGKDLIYYELNRALYQLRVGRIRWNEIYRNFEVHQEQGHWYVVYKGGES